MMNSLEQIKNRHTVVKNMIDIGSPSVQNAFMQASHLDRALLIRVLEKTCTNPSREVDRVVKSDLAKAVGSHRPSRIQQETGNG